MTKVQVEGRNAVLELLKQGGLVREILVDENARIDKRLGRIFELAEQQGVRVIKKPRRVLDEMSFTSEHMGIIASANAPQLPTRLIDVIEECDRKKVDPFLVLIPEIQHRQNLGAIIRTANAAGVHAIVLSRGTEYVFSPEVTRISMAANFFTPVIRMSTYSAIKMLKTHGISIIGADASGEIPYFEVNMRGAVTLCLGSEGKGLSEEFMRRCDHVVNIPMVGIVSSLNVSVSFGILVYEKVRQKRALGS
ncbi:MAG: 23S rRNA (guanosine(2251)-2'-O)-methyltransferase RlmB [Armatimonadetes bacterium]|nr:23S rRNA (guanosine(2251)-2'-O)-methyltransferase RlmB [Armatimonadota bacterium]